MLGFREFASRAHTEIIQNILVLSRESDLDYWFNMTVRVVATTSLKYSYGTHSQVEEAELQGQFGLLQLKTNSATLLYRWTC